MKITYLVKKNPLEEGKEGNWIIMDVDEFNAFAATEEGMRRKGFFAQLPALYLSDEEMIYFETESIQIRKESQAEINHMEYLYRNKRDCEFSFISIENEWNGIPDGRFAEEEMVNAIELDNMREAITSLDPKEKKLLSEVCLSDNPKSYEAFAEENHMSIGAVYKMKERIIKKLRRMMGY